MSALQEHQEKLERSANQSRLALQTLLFIVAIAALYFARDFLLPVILAFFIALTLRPAVRFLQKFVVPPWLAATVFVILLVFSGVMVGYLISGPISDWINQAPRLQQQFTSKFAGISEIITKFSNLTDQIQNASTPAQGSSVQEVVVKQHLFPGLLVSMTSYPIQFAVTLAATLVIAIFLLASGDLFYEKLVRILPNLTARKKALHIVYDIESEISTYVLTLGAVNAFLGLVIAISFQALGMPSAYLWGMLIFIFNFVPYVGTLAGICLSGFMAIVSFDSVSYAMLLPLTYAGWALLESEIIRPQILGSRFEMNAVAILLFLAFWSWLWGIPGAAIAVPMLVTVKIFCNHVEGLAGLGEFLSRRAPDKSETAGVSET
jgi:predicted PurR-regulated permease PerM